eukprot:m.62467 g.62467  ORF g.62467 m.62467 type:complete len:1449 (-) comp13351_c0_seq2:223-4569(-)
MHDLLRVRGRVLACALVVLAASGCFSYRCDHLASSVPGTEGTFTRVHYLANGVTVWQQDTETGDDAKFIFHHPGCTPNPTAGDGDNDGDGRGDTGSPCPQPVGAAWYIATAIVTNSSDLANNSNVLAVAPSTAASPDEIFPAEWSYRSTDTFVPYTGTQAVRCRLACKNDAQTSSDVCECEPLAGWLTVDCSNRQLSVMPLGIPLITGRLYLNNNELTSLPEDAFNGMDELFILYLYINRLTSLPETVFYELPKLQNLHINTNSLTSLPSNLLIHNPTLSEFRVTRNWITSVPRDLFAHNPRVRAVSLSENLLTSLDPQTFAKTYWLRSLVLSGNQLTSSNLNLTGATYLRDVSLDWNQLQEFPMELLQHAPRLQNVRLEHNSIVRVPSTVASLETLQVLDMSANPSQCWVDHWQALETATGVPTSHFEPVGFDRRLQQPVYEHDNVASVDDCAQLCLDAGDCRGISYSQAGQHCQLHRILTEQMPDCFYSSCAMITDPGYTAYKRSIQPTAQIKCACAALFAGDGYCQKIGSCSENNGGCGDVQTAECIQQGTTLRCQCFEGYSAVNGLCLDSEPPVLYCPAVVMPWVPGDVDASTATATPEFVVQAVDNIDGVLNASRIISRPIASGDAVAANDVLGVSVTATDLSNRVSNCHFDVVPVTMPATRLTARSRVSSPLMLTNMKVDGAIPATLAQRFSFFAGDTLPPGTSLDEATGQLLGTPSVPGNFAVIIEVIDSQATSQSRTSLQPVMIKVDEPLRIAGSRVETTMGAPLSTLAPQVNGGSGNFNFRLGSGNLPDGVVVMPASGLITGTAQEFGDFDVVVTVQDNLTAAEEDLDGITLAVLPPLELADINATRHHTVLVGSPVSVAAAKVTGGVEDSYKYTTTDPLPRGVGLLENGQIQGTAGEEGVFEYNVTVADMHGATLDLPTRTLTVKAPQSQTSAALSSAQITITAIGAVAAVLLILLLAVVYAKRKRPPTPKDMGPVVQGLQLDVSGTRVIPRELKRGHLTIVKELGRGHFGAVHSALLNEKSVNGIPAYPVAVKTLHPDAPATEQQTFVKEAALMAQFSHPHITELIGVVTAGEPTLIVLAYAEHGNLLDYLRQSQGFRALSLASKLQIGAEVSDGMAYLASRSFVHRDLAARNVLLGSDFKCRIADFGLSRELVDDDLYYKSVGGTIPVRWTAPECLASRKFSVSSDVWSFAILLHECFSDGRKPYENWTNEQTWLQVKGGYRLPRERSCPSDVYRVMRACWLTEPMRRPSFAWLHDFFSKALGAEAGAPAETADADANATDERKPRQSSLMTDSGGSGEPIALLESSYVAADGQAYAVEDVGVDPTVPNALVSEACYLTEDTISEAEKATPPLHMATNPYQDVSRDTVDSTNASSSYLVVHAADEDEPTAQLPGAVDAAANETSPTLVGSTSNPTYMADGFGFHDAGATQVSSTRM